MAGVVRRGDSFLITVYQGYEMRDKKNGGSKEYTQRKKTTTFHPPDGVTPAKAEKLARQYAAVWEDKIRGFVALDENRTFEDLAEWYYANVAPTVLKENVAIDNKSIIDTYIMPTLGREKLKNITPQMLDTLFRSLRTGGRVKQVFHVTDSDIFPRWGDSEMSRKTGISRHTIQKARLGLNIERDGAEKIAAYLERDFDDIFVSGVDNRELADGSISRIRRCLSAIFSAATRKEIMRRNPVSNTEPVKRGRMAASFLDETQAAALLAALDAQNNFQFKVMITMLLFTGMRGGELCGLKWDCVDMEKGIVYIRATLAYNSGNKSKGKEKYSLQAPKTVNSERYVLIPGSLVDLLKEQKAKQEERRAFCGKGWIDRGTVFTTVNGEYYSESYLNIQFKRIAKKIGLPDGVHIHSLRHTTASLLINSDVSPKVISEQLGHASTAITQDLYSHVFASSKLKAMQALELKLGK
jgi:integrase